MGDLDIGHKAYDHSIYKKLMKPYSSTALITSPLNLFLPSHSETSWLEYQEKGLLHYRVAGVDIVTMDSGFYVDRNNPYRK